MSPDRTDAGELVARLVRMDPGRRRLLADRLCSGGPVALPRNGQALPASFFQERLWLVDQLLPGSPAYVIALTLRLRGDLDAELLSRAWQVLVRRHEVLRTQLEWTDGRLAQRVLDHVPVPLRVLDLTAVEDVLAEVRQLLAREAATGVDLAQAPLFRVRLLRLSTRDHVLGVYLHHAVTDGWSNGILLRELGAVYHYLWRGVDPVLPPLPLQYADAAAWHRSQLTEHRLAELAGYWTDRLADAPALLELPTDRQRAVGSTRPLGRHEFMLPAAPSAALRTLAARERSTTFVVLLSGFVATLARWAGCGDIVVGSPVTGRDHPDLEGVVGPFVNTVVLRVAVPRDATTRELVRQARGVVLGAQEHADLPFERLVEILAPRRDSSYNPVFQVNFAVGNFPRQDLTLPLVVAEPVVPADAGAARFDLSLYVMDSHQTFHFGMEYDRRLFDQATVVRVAEGLCALLTAGAEEPDAPLAEVTMDLAGESAARRAAAAAPNPPATRYVRPRDQWERDVAQAWSEVLNAKVVGATDDFFALGGHSMAGMLALDLLRQRTGRLLPLATLMRHPTVEGLAAALRMADGDTRVVVPLSVTPSGVEDRPPLFLMPPATGELIVYHDLAGLLGSHRPVYGVQSPPDPAPTLRQQAARYADEIAAHDTGKPYHLCGFSAAGRLALAVADQLTERNDEVGAVVLLDTAPFGDVGPDPDLATVLARWLPYAPARAELAGLERQAQIGMTLAAGVRAGDVPPTFTIDQFDEWCRRVEHNARALAGYDDPSYPGPVTLFVRQGHHRDLAAEWAVLPVGELRTETVDVGDHMGFVAGPTVTVVAERIEACLTAEDTERQGGTRWESG